MNNNLSRIGALFLLVVGIGLMLYNHHMITVDHQYELRVLLCGPSLIIMGIAIFVDPRFGRVRGKAAAGVPVFYRVIGVVLGLVGLGIGGIIGHFAYHVF